MQESKSIIEVNGVSKFFGEKTALDHVTLNVKKGEFVTILGPSGCGKTTLLRLIAGFQTASEGEIKISGKEITQTPPHKRPVNTVFQKYALFPHLNVYDNIAFGLKLKKMPKQTIEKKVKAALKMVGMTDYEDRDVDSLSGGQQQRVALARILASDPEVLMLDEPFSALDAFLKEKLQLELLELLSGYDKDILMVTHSRDEIYRFCEHMLIVENGRQAGFGATKEIFKNPGTPAAAKLTGCKNIEKIERVDDHTMVLPNWNTTVCVKGMIPENTTHIGIRAHYLRLPENGQRENLVECQNGRILDDPFELVVVFEHDVWWKIPKESWQKEYQEKMPQYLVIPEESILYLHG